MNKRHQITPPSSLISSMYSLYIDFDGTLIDIASHPKSVIIPDGLSFLLCSLHTKLKGRVTLLTGRKYKDIIRYVPDFPGHILASHGSQWKTEGKAINTTPKSDNHKHIQNEAKIFAKTIPGLLFEKKPYGGTLHFRRAPHEAGTIETFAHHLIMDNPDYKLEPAKMALEIKHKDISKGKSLQKHMTQMGWLNTHPIHIGDDISDISAFHASEDLQGFGISVGLTSPSAKYFLPNPEQTRHWLYNAFT